MSRSVGYLKPGVPVVATKTMPKGHKASTIAVDGIDVTREATLFLVKMWRERIESIPNADQFMLEILAAANHDLVVCGYAPLSEDEVVADSNPIAQRISPQRVKQLRDVYARIISSGIAREFSR